MHCSQPQVSSITVCGRSPPVTWEASLSYRAVSDIVNFCYKAHYLRLSSEPYPMIDVGISVGNFRFNVHFQIYRGGSMRCGPSSLSNVSTQSVIERKIYLILRKDSQFSNLIGLHYGHKIPKPFSESSFSSLSCASLLLFHTINKDIHLLIVKTQPPSNNRGLRSRIPIIPNRILDLLPVDRHIVIAFQN